MLVWVPEEQAYRIEGQFTEFDVEMALYDNLPPHVRKLFRDQPDGVRVAEVREQLRKLGPGWSLAFDPQGRPAFVSPVTQTFTTPNSTATFSRWRS